MSNSVWVTCFLILFSDAHGQSETGTGSLPLVSAEASSAGALPTTVGNDGAFRYAVPIEVPPARDELLTPRLSIQYSSARRFATGAAEWELTSTYIELDHFGRRADRNFAFNAETGLFRSEKWNIVRDGATEPLHAIGDGRYRPFKSTEYLEIRRTDSGWEASDARGVRYQFNQKQLGTGSVVFRWHLSEVLDSRGNFVRYSYIGADGSSVGRLASGALLLSRVEWNAPSGASITMTGPQHLYRHSIDLEYEARPDHKYVAALGIVSTLGKRLARVRVFSRDAAGHRHVWRTYHLQYDRSASSGRSQLASVLVSGFGCEPHEDDVSARCEPDAALPRTRFAYARGSFQFSETSHLLQSQGAELPADIAYGSAGAEPLLAGGYRNMGGLIDIDGDGRPDYVDIVYDGREVDTTWTIRANHSARGGGGYALGNSNTWREIPPTADRRDTNSLFSLQRFANLMDLTGDGRPDAVVRGGSVEGWAVHANTGAGFEPRAQFWDTGGVMRYLRANLGSIGAALSDYTIDALGLPRDKRTSLEDARANARAGYVRHRVIGAVVDITGDGIPDFVFTDVRGGDAWWVFPGFRTTSRSPEGFIGGFSGEPTRWRFRWDSTAAHTRPMSLAETFTFPWELRQNSTVTTLEVDGAPGRTQTLGILADLNGDGLPDLVSGHLSREHRVWINDGTGFTSMRWTGDELLFPSANGRLSPEEVTFSDPSSGLRVAARTRGLLDINGDGLVDLVYRDEEEDRERMRVAFGSGSGFRTSTVALLEAPSGTNRAVIESWETIGSVRYVRQALVDLDGDGRLDIVDARGGTGWRVLALQGTDPIGRSEIPGLLVRIDNGVGGGLDIYYGPSTAIASIRLPFSTPLVRRIQVLLGRSPGAITSAGSSPIEITYAGGGLVPAERDGADEFRGFLTVRAWRPGGIGVETRYELRRDALVGHPILETFLDANGCAYRRRSMDWTSKPVDAHETAYLSYISREKFEHLQVTYSRDQCSSLAMLTRTREVLAVDEFGQSTVLFEHGDDARAGDEFFTMTDYARTSDGSPKDAVSRIRLCADRACNSELLRTEFLYDGDLANDRTALPLGYASAGRLKRTLTHNYDLSQPSVPPTLVEVERRAYDPSGRLIRVVRPTSDRSGKEVAYEYAPNDWRPVREIHRAWRPDATTVSDQLVQSYTNDMARGVVVQRIDENGIAHRVDHDPFHRPTKHSYRQQDRWITKASIDRSYNANGMTVSENAVHGPTDMSRSVTEFDGLGRVVKEWNPLGADHGGSIWVTREIAYDGHGRVISERKPGAQPNYPHLERRMRYDYQGRVAEVIVRPFQITPPAGTLVTDVTASVFVTRYRYTVDTDGLRTEIDSPHSTQPHVQATPKVVVKDALDRVRRIVDELGSEVLYDYNQFGFLTTVTRHLDMDADWCRDLGTILCTGRVPISTRIGYDSLGRRLWLEDPDKGRIRFSYDYAGNALHIEQSDVGETIPTRVLVRTYDDFGRLTDQIAESWDGTAWVADESSRVRFTFDTVEARSAHPAPSFGRGRLLEVSTTSNRTYFSYDPLGRIVRQARDSDLDGVVDLQVRFGLSLQGRLQSIEYFGGVLVNYEYSSAGWIRRIYAAEGDRDHVLFEARRYTQFGLPSVVYRSGDRIAESFEYDAVTAQLRSHRINAAGPLWDISYTNYDSNGNVARVVDRMRGVTHTYQYDALDRLTDAMSLRSGPVVEPEDANEYVIYDSLGNIRKRFDRRLGGATYFAYSNDGTRAHLPRAFGADRQGVLRLMQQLWDSSSRLDRSTALDVLSCRMANRLTDLKRIEWSYGNVRAVQCDYNSAFTTDDRLHSVTDVETGAIEVIDHDGLGQRAARRIQIRGGAEELEWMLGRWITRRVSNTSAGQRAEALEAHVWMGDVRLASLVRGRTGSRTERHYLLDVTGNVRFVLDRDAVVLNMNRYSPYGQAVYASAPGQSRFGFGGYAAHGHGKLLAAGERYYDPQLMQYVSADAIVPQPGIGLAYNRYAYVYNNPTNLVDPSGRNPIIFLGMAFGAISGSLSGIAAAEEAGINGWIGGVVGFGFGAAFGAISASVGLGVESLLTEALSNAFVGAFVGVALRTAIEQVGRTTIVGAASGNLRGADIAKAMGLGAFLGAFVGLGEAASISMTVPALFGSGTMEVKFLGLNWITDSVGGGLTTVLGGGDFWSGFVPGLSVGATKFFGSTFLLGSSGVASALSAQSKGAGDAVALIFGGPVAAVSGGALAAYGIGGLIGLAADGESGFHSAALAGLGIYSGVLAVSMTAVQVAR